MGIGQSRRLIPDQGRKETLSCCNSNRRKCVMIGIEFGARAVSARYEFLAHNGSSRFPRVARPPLQPANGLRTAD
ncbi:Protein of unknown function [Gryllus bimaculatus]|nr:Protein of unknown function [Gryllus bimaculatus]